MKIEKVEKLIANLHDKIKYVIDIRNSKRKLNHKLVLKKAHRVIRFNQSSWLKPVIDMNTDLRRKAKKKDFETGVLKSMNNGVFRKTMKNVRKHRDIKLFTTEWRKNYLVLEPNYHTSTFFTEYLLAIEMNNTQILANKPVYLGLLILEISKILMYEFCYDYVKPKYSDKRKIVLYGYRHMPSLYT